MTDKGTTREDAEAGFDDPSDAFRRQPPKLDPRQVAAWREMSPAQRLELAFQAYHFALDAVRTTERERHPDLAPEELAWRVTRRIRGDPKLRGGDQWSG